MILFVSIMGTAIPLAAPAAYATGIVYRGGGGGRTLCNSESVGDDHEERALASSVPMDLQHDSEALSSNIAYILVSAFSDWIGRSRDGEG